MKSNIDRVLAGHGEMFLGLVSPIGTDPNLVNQALDEAFKQCCAPLQTVKVIEILRRIRRKDGAVWTDLDSADLADRYTRRIESGNRFCRDLGRPDALMHLAVHEIGDFRKKQAGNRHLPLERQPYLFRSLKRRPEVDTLRRIYGDGFLLVAVQSPLSARARHLAGLIAKSRGGFQVEKHLGEAYELIDADTKQVEDFGQDVQEIFKSADLFVDGRDARVVRESCARFVRLIYGDSFETPTQDELGMAIAATAALRSADLARQVGAAIMSASGSILAVGCNEVPAPFGGQVWPGTKMDHRDFAQAEDLTADIRTRVLEDVVKRLAEQNLLDPAFQERVRNSPTEAVKAAYEAKNSKLQGARVLGSLEYGRAVHAEMAAIVDAARRGTALEGSTLYTTTFPCHECTRHILASGISRVVYVESYPKSLSPILFKDLVDFDGHPSCGGNPTDKRIRFEQFVGISPQIFGKVFPMRTRRADDGSVASWKREKEGSRFLADPRPIFFEEQRIERRLSALMAKNELVFV